MIHIFGTVASYEQYARELRRNAEIAALRQCGNRPLAEFQVRKALSSHGIPILEHGLPEG